MLHRNISRGLPKIVGLNHVRRRLRAGVAGLDLDRRVGDREALVQLATQPGEEAVVEIRCRADQMDGERRLGRAHRPDVQVVDLARRRAARPGTPQPRPGRSRAAPRPARGRPNRAAGPRCRPGSPPRWRGWSAGRARASRSRRSAARPRITPTVIPASAAMCRKAPWMLRSFSRPRMNISAVPPLTSTPTPATQNTIPVATGSGACRRWTASQAMAPMATSSSMALASAARIELRRRP